MTLFLQAHRLRMVMIMSLTTCCLLGVSEGSFVSFPQLAGYSQPILLSFLLTILYGPMTAVAFNSASLAFESLSVRRLVAGDCAVLAVEVLPVSAMATVNVAVGRSANDWLGVERNVFFYVAVTLLLLFWVRPEVAAGACTAYFVLSSALGVHGAQSIYWWAWVRAAPTHLSTAVSFSAFLTIVVLFHCLIRGRVGARLARQVEIGDE